MKKALFILILVSLFQAQASAANVSVSIDRVNVSVGETVILHLEINTTSAVGGQFVLYRETAPKRYELVKTFYDSPSCAVCGGALPLSRDLSANYHHAIIYEGNYMAEAAFGGAADRVYFSASKPSTTTSTTTTSTSMPRRPEETTVSLSIDRVNLSVGDTVYLRLEVVPSEPVGGQFVLYRQTQPKRYSLLTVLYSKPSPEQCVSCAGEEPLKEPYSAAFNYTLNESGIYWAEANFGGARDSVYFNVTGTDAAPSTASASDGYGIYDYLGMLLFLAALVLAALMRLKGFPGQ